MMWGYGYSWPMMFWMAVWNLFWLVLLGLAIWALVRWLTRFTSERTRRDGSPAGPSALEILRQRYARGEIDTETFEHMRERLQVPNAHETPLRQA